MRPALAVYAKLERLGQRLADGQQDLFQRHGIPACIARLGSASCVYFSRQLPAD